MPHWLRGKLVCEYQNSLHALLYWHQFVFVSLAANMHSGILLMFLNLFLPHPCDLFARSIIVITVVSK